MSIRTEHKTQYLKRLRGLLEYLRQAVFDLSGLLLAESEADQSRSDSPGLLARIGLLSGVALLIWIVAQTI